MKKHLTSGVVVLFLVCLFLPGVSLGSGFYIDLQDAKGMGMGGAVIAQANNPSALFYNPAGITQLEGTQISLGSTIIPPSVEFDDQDRGINTETDTNYWWVPNFYITYKFNDHVWVGLGNFTNFALGTEWPSDWVGRYNSYEATIKSSTFNPTVAYKFNDKFSIAGGLMVQYIDVRMKQKIGMFQILGLPNDPFNNPSTDIKNELNGDDVGYGFNVALRYQPFDWLSFGASYRSEVEHDIGNGNVDNSHQDSMAAGLTAVTHAAGPMPGVTWLQLLQAEFPDTSGSASLTLPQTLFFGVAVKPLKPLTVEFAGYWTGWSSWDKLRLDFDKAIGGATVSETRKDWDDTLSWRVGIEYLLHDTWAFRFGYVYDQSPIPDDTLDFMVPADDRNMFNFGLGYSYKKFTVDGAYTYLIIDDRDVSANPEIYRDAGELHDGHAHMFSLSLSYKF